VIELRQVSKHYDRTQVLAPTDLRVETARTTVLIGPSGSGKSTLLRLMVGLVEPTAGEVWVAGERLAGETVEALRWRMGYVIQEGGLFPHLTARANVVFMARYLGWAQDRIEGRLEELLDMTGLSRELLRRFPSQLSGGQRQRVSLMRALMLDPEVLLLDEPLGALDPMIRFALQEELATLFARLSKTVVLVTHDLAEASFFADRILLLHEGRIAQDGLLRDFIQAPAEPFVTRFVEAQRARERS
jgi:osmoprotectant transport system ATP-binding protein